jgi:hypothetical protein
MHRQPVESMLAEKLSLFIRDINDADLNRATFFFIRVKDVWQFLEADIRQKLENYVLNLPSDDLTDLEFFLDYPPLREMARMRVARATRKELSNAVFFRLPERVGDRYIALYLESTSFDQANEWANELMLVAPELSINHQKTLVAGIKGNNQIVNSFEFGLLLSRLRTTKAMPAEDFDELLRANGLQELLPKAGAV